MDSQRYGSGWYANREFILHFSQVKGYIITWVGLLFQNCCRFSTLDRSDPINNSVNVVNINRAIVVILSVLVVSLLLLRVTIGRCGSAGWYRIVQRRDVGEVLVRVRGDTRH